MISLGFIFAWLVIAGVTFKFTGHNEIEAAKGKRTEKYKRLQNKYGPSSSHQITCRKSRNYGYDYDCSCKLSHQAPTYLPWTLVWTTLFWPVWWLQYGIVNGTKAFRLYKGPEWTYFKQPPRVLTQEEKDLDLQKRLAISEARTAELEKQAKIGDYSE